MAKVGVQMNSINADINALHAAYNEAMASELPLNAVFERGWLMAHQWGVTPDCVKLVVKSRRDGIRKGERRENCLLIRNFCGSDEAVAGVLEESSMIRAKMRVRVLDKGKAEVLRATGREDAPRPADARHISEVFGDLKKASGL